MQRSRLQGVLACRAPGGRDARLHGNPIDISRMLAVSDGVVYVERCALSSFKHIRKAKKAIKKAFQCQLDDLGFSIVELLSPCPTNWKISPKDAWAWVNEEMVKTYPLGVIKDVTGYEDKQ